MSRLLDGRPVARAVRREVARGVEELVGRGLRPPGLAAVRVGDDPASEVYVASKERAAKAAGFRGEVLALPAETSDAELEARIVELNRRPEIDGILVQLPLPAGLSEEAAIAAIDPAKDVDGLHPLNVGRLWLDRPGPAPATPAGIVRLLDHYEVPLEGRRAVVVGRSRLVGKPLAALLLRRHATVTVCHSRTRDLAAVCRRAELLVAAAGRLALVGAEHVAEGAVVVDVGIHRVTDRATVERLFPGDGDRLERLAARGRVLAGDVDFERVAARAAAITPVPGGVGPLTVAMLLANTLTACRARQGLAEPPE